jgi:hypothetical protein
MKYYRCPYHCGDPRFPQPKWKTEKGYLNHLAKCPNRPEVVEERNRRREEQEKEDKEEKEKALANFEYKIGDKIIVCSYRVTKPIYEQRGTRRVKVRYEEERKYFAKEIEIFNITYHNRIIINNSFEEDEIVTSSLLEADKLAEEKQKRWDQYLYNSSLMR